jgi:cystathionine beta-lyase/cystathionine gamma-synthase
VLCPTISEQGIKDMEAVLRSGWWGFGPKTIELEKKFAEYVGSKYAIATNSGTAALDLCLKAHNIKGGELITTPMTFVADAIVWSSDSFPVTTVSVAEILALAPVGPVAPVAPVAPVSPVAPVGPGTVESAPVGPVGPC